MAVMHRFITNTYFQNSPAELADLQTTTSAFLMAISATIVVSFPAVPTCLAYSSFGAATGRAWQPASTTSSSTTGTTGTP